MAESKGNDVVSTTEAEKVIDEAIVDVLVAPSALGDRGQKNILRFLLDFGFQLAPYRLRCQTRNHFRDSSNAP